jgi:hypothetical protein
MDPSKAIKQIEQTISELKESLANKQTNNECYVLFDLRMKALCGVYLNKEDVLSVIDTKHREDIKIEIDSLRLKIINGENLEHNIVIFHYLENQLKNTGANKKMTGYDTGSIYKMNYCYYSLPLNSHQNIILSFPNIKPQPEK